MEKKKILVTILIGLLLATGLALVGCEEKVPCPGTGNCTITVKQTANGLAVDYDAPRSDCGRSSTYKSNGDEVPGCFVHKQNGWNTPTKVGVISCSCD